MKPDMLYQADASKLKSSEGVHLVRVSLWNFQKPQNSKRGLNKLITVLISLLFTDFCVLIEACRIRTFLHWKAVAEMIQNVKKKLRTYFGPRVSIERIQFAHFFLMFIVFFCACVFSAMFSDVLCSFFGMSSKTTCKYMWKCNVTS